MYVCRTLSYEGVEFEVVEAPLEPEMMVNCTVYCMRQQLDIVPVGKLMV